MIYKTSMSNLVKGITMGVAILFIIIIIAQYSIITDTGRNGTFYTAVTLLLIYFIAFSFRPINYKIINNLLVIHRLFIDVKIERDNIKSVELIDKNKIHGAIRIFGVGGLFGYFGNFANFEMGKMIWYATRKDRTVLINTKDNKKIILTPDEPEEFVAAFKV